MVPAAAGRRARASSCWPLSVGAAPGCWPGTGWPWSWGCTWPITRPIRLWLKHEPIVDLAAVSAGFVLRAIAGGVATGVVLSNWFLIVASFGSLLIVTGKRSGEQKLLRRRHRRHRIRQTLGLLHPSFLRTVRTLSAAVTVDRVLPVGVRAGRGQSTPATHPIWFQLTIVPSCIGLLHVLRLLDAGHGAAPEELALGDHRLQIYGVVLGGAVRGRASTLRHDRRIAGRHRRSLLTGWGRTAPTAADVVHAVHPDVVDEAMVGRVTGGAARPRSRG